MNDRLSKAEIRKDAVQEGFTAATHTVGAVAGIVVGAVGDIGRALGGFATELFEIRDSVRRAGRDHEDHMDPMEDSMEDPMEDSMEDPMEDGVDGDALHDVEDLDDVDEVVVVEADASDRPLE